MKVVRTVQPGSSDPRTPRIARPRPRGDGARPRRSSGQRRRSPRRHTGRGRPLDRPAVVGLLGDADGAVHTASPGDATSADLDAAVADAAIEGLDRHRPSLHPHQRRVDLRHQLVDHRGVAAQSARAGGVEGADRTAGARGERHARGRSRLQRRLRRRRRRDPGLLLGSPRDEDGNLIMLGTGQQHWSTVHAADLAVFFRRVLESASAHGRYVIGDGLNPTVADLTEAAAVAAGAPGAVSGSDAEARARLGDYFAEVLLLDQGTAATRARAELDWSPSGPGLVHELRRELPKVTAG